MSVGTGVLSLSCGKGDLSGKDLQISTNPV